MNHDTNSNKYNWIASRKTIIISGKGVSTDTISNLYSQHQMKEKQVGIYVSVPVFCILILSLAIIGISLIWMKWAWDSDTKLLRWYVANAVHETEFVDDHILLRRSNVARNEKDGMCTGHKSVTRLF